MHRSKERDMMGTWTSFHLGKSGKIELKGIEAVTVKIIFFVISGAAPIESIESNKLVYHEVINKNRF